MSFQARKSLIIHFGLILAITAGIFTAFPTRAETSDAIVGTWSALGSNPAGTDGAISGSAPFPAEVDFITVSGTDVYVGGCFQNAGGDPTADYVAKWDTLTETWSGLGNEGTSTP